MLRWPVEPMRAVGADTLPEGSAARDTVYEPKWDGFRLIAWIGRDGVRLQSRNGRDLSRFLPELCRTLADHLAPGLVLDGEAIIWDRDSGRTSFARLQQRFNAGRRLAVEAARHPAHFVAFDLLQNGRGQQLLDEPLSGRRRRLQRLLSSAPADLVLCPQTGDPAAARSWFAEWSATGVEGVVVKSSRETYRPGATGWVKVKTRHTEDYVVGGVTGAIDRPGSLLLGRYDERGTLRFVGQTHRLRVEHRRELAGLRPMVFRGGNSGHPWPCPLPAGWSADFADRAPLPYVPVEPTVVVEVDADLARDGAFERLRHRCRFVRVRPELTPQDVVTISRISELSSRV